jgi:hypothetical protein
MASFAAALKPEDTAAIRAYLVSRAQEMLKSGAGRPPAAAAPPAQAHEAR